MKVQFLPTIIEVLALAAVWAAFTWRAQSSGEMMIWPLVNLRQRKWPGVFVFLLAIRWVQVTGLVVLAALFAVGVLPLR
jgi:hypothetical protein